MKKKKNILTDDLPIFTYWMNGMGYFNFMEIVVLI